MTKASPRRKQKIGLPKIAPGAQMHGVSKKSRMLPPGPYKTGYTASIHIPTAAVHPRRRDPTHARESRTEGLRWLGQSQLRREPLRQQHRFRFAPPLRIYFDWESDRVCWMSTLKSRLNVDGATMKFQEHCISLQRICAAWQSTAFIVVSSIISFP
ncbi:hypothetical protein MBM_07637 [Drepanopeziza brunnea f. sp. 'multigermtubi' MB_m1]|uniref:Uncharacterized protein n=1 Tax=Marssonina brunnea f. sp. multigermtubi (strain MB_m1) TaxID=1072389 RepID=K1WPU5_MARBU|nr:uncharacterized protein MBM_07637 [Drepanopeziza brunnea f. sp. 'multigermtubi' MB_m1]EKD14407.1 hypothetical protein MBM_07637 [Drepanopeziza brunnea f. sp. 'multigermtubi' MB_m1]